MLLKYFSGKYTWLQILWQTLIWYWCKKLSTTFKQRPLIIQGCVNKLNTIKEKQNRNMHVSVNFVKGSCLSLNSTLSLVILSCHSFHSLKEMLSTCLRVPCQFGDEKYRSCKSCDNILWKSFCLSSHHASTLSA